MTARIKEMKMKRKINTIAVIMGGKHIKSMPEVKAIEVTVPAPGGIRIGIMPGAGADPDPVFRAGTDLMPIGERMGMDACVFFVKYFSLKKASEFPFFSKGFSLPSAGIMHPCA